MDVDALEVRRCYRIRSRNLRVAVWDGESFIGVREKFDARFLDSEYPNHTVRDAVPLDVFIPEDVSLEIVAGSRCMVCGADAWWLGPPAPAAWRCAGPCADEDVRAMAVRNTVLFDLIDALGDGEAAA